MKITKTEHSLTTKVHPTTIEHNGVSYDFLVLEKYYVGDNFNLSVEIIPVKSTLEKESFYPEIEQYINDNIKTIINIGR